MPEGAHLLVWLESLAVAAPDILEAVAERTLARIHHAPNIAFEAVRRAGVLLY